MTETAKSSRRTVPVRLAVIDADRCTGCAACIEVCPANCIAFVASHVYDARPGGWCEVDWGRCIGCQLCVRVPTRKADSHRLLVCPWEAIEMVPRGELSERVNRMGGPRKYVEANRDRLLEMAKRQAAGQEGK